MRSRLPIRFEWIFPAAIAAILLVVWGPARALGVAFVCGAALSAVCRRGHGAPPIRVWEWNPADGSVACPAELLGFEKAKRRVFTASQVERLVHTEDHGRLIEVFETAARGKTAFDAEFRVIWPDGTLHWLVVKGSGGSGVVLDITSIRQPEAALRESERRFRNAFEEAAVGMVILDAAGHIQSVNRGFTEIMQYSAAEVAGSRLMLLASKDQHPNMEHDLRLIAGGAMPNFRRERRFIRKDGVGVWVRTSVAALVLDGKPHTVGLMEDITEQKQARDQLNRQAMHDPLTGLANRLHFEETLQTAIHSAGAGEIALLYIDLDGFKLVNDTLGHRAGDLVLKEVASRIGNSLRGAGLLARIGGDEFTIVLKDVGGAEEAVAAAERVLEAFRTLFRIEGHEVSIGASIGISRYPLDGKDASALLQSADAAMYCAKRSGNNRYQLFTAQMRQEAYQRLVMEMCLRNALEHREISVLYQPQYELATGKLAGFEALCRWANPAMGPVSPDRFIPLAEETGVIVNIGKYVLREACRQALQWQTPDSSVRVAVNVSATQFARPDFVNSVVEILQETGLKPALLELEMTESSVIQDREDAVRKMQDLRRLGVRFSIDDFGTGYSSLSYIQYMPVDVLKIDRSFTAKLGTSRRALSMVRAIIAMARALGLRVVTEGVEKPAQVEVLRELGCDDVQGYYFGKPESGEASVARALQTKVVMVAAEAELAGVA
jgi:diguanylate cyclase (GGDEF)-like protein/PAS domain S-box-containing protein